MKKPFLALMMLACLGASLPASAQTVDSARSDAILKKVAQLDVLIQVVPLLLTKEQIPPLLLAIEKVKQRQKELFAQEAKDLTTIESKINKVVDDGINKNIYPPREVQGEVATFMRAAALRRSLFYNEMTDLVFLECKKTLNEGQLKTMEKSLKPELLDPSIKVDQMDSDAKIKFFVRKVILDPNAYDVLVQMSKKKD
ncbi:hypothetical protein EON82_23950 [bacterium]|nr:MAG: hypothetical protein EON82_23950 [bacterium]